jgi:hypothetical protein
LQFQSRFQRQTLAGKGHLSVNNFSPANFLRIKPSKQVQMMNLFLGVQTVRTTMKNPTFLVLQMHQFPSMMTIWQSIERA